MPYRFDDFVVDADTRQLLRSGAEIHITPKALDLLLLLIDERARAVSKSELQERIWPATFVEETNLASLAAEIRRALGDNAGEPKYIRTVYGFGYRFVGNATVHSTASTKLWLTWERREIPLMEGENVIGRAADAAIRIDSPSLSRSHARIVVHGTHATLHDLGSKNGTQLNGNRITDASPLNDGDEIQLGAIVLKFRVGSPVGETVSMPPTKDSGRP